MAGEDAGQFETLVQGWAQERGWLLESRGTQDIEGWSEIPGLQAVVEAGSGLAAEAFANAASGVMIVTVDHPTAIAGELLSTVGKPNVRHDQAGFLAGALTGLASQSWVVATISTGGENEAVYLAAFEHGLKYSCPRCWPVKMGALEATPDELQAQRVDAVFVLPGASQEPSLSSLSASNVWVVYVDEAPQAVPAERIAGGVVFDAQPILLAALEDLAAGEGGIAWPYDAQSGSLHWSSLNAQAISPGRERILEATLLALSSGELEIGVDPVTGEER